MKILRCLVALFFIFQTMFSPLAGAETLPYSLVDKQQYSIFEEEQAARQEEELAVEDPPDDAQLLKYSNDFWHQAVTAVDGAYSLDNEPEPIPDLTLLNPSLSLPLYGTSIALTGRYVLGFQLANKKYKKDANNNVTDRNQHSAKMTQEMQLKMQGKVMDRVFVDIDYDDQREDEKTLSIAYRGKPGEVVQSAEFGDINLSLPQTEFIAYEKQLFGAKMHLQHKNANLYLIGSQTKGSSKQKQFVGSSVSEIVSIADISYVRRTYYDLTFGGNIRGAGIPTDANDDWRNEMGNISSGSEEIYLDSNTTSSDYVPVTKEATDYLGGTSYTAKWQLLNRGVDYTVDYVRGIITFKRSIAADAVIAVDYVNSRGERLSEKGGVPNTIKLIKTENDKPWTSSADETAYRLEIKRFYNIGAQKITPDNGAGNFILRLLDANSQEVGASATPPQLYPSTIDVDFDRGVFELDSRMSDDAGLYNATPVSSRNRTFQVQYENTVKTYFIESGIVIQSETVKLNGRKLTRNNDYYIDYTSGFITFYKAEEITDNAVIDITYDTTVGSSSNNSVLGGRLDYKLFDKIVMGATAINEGGEKPTTVPQVGAYSSNILVYGADINGRDIKLSDRVSFDFSAEGAHSEKKQNLFGYAMIDSMSDANEKVSGSMVFYDWIIASNPSGQPNFLDAVRWDTQDIPSLEINPHSIATYNDKQQVLVIDYDFTQGVDWDGRDEVSIVYPISKNGMDLSSKTSFELTMLGEAGGPQVQFTFGNINEDSDSSGGMTTQCGSGVPKTEDIYCRNTLAPNEDIGWLYRNPDGSEQRYNPFVHNVYNPESQPNGRLDTQDLNGNGKFDAENIPTGGVFGFGGTNIDGLPGNMATNTVWQTFSMPFTISDKKEWTAVRHLRITLKKGTNLKGQIKIAHVGLSGTAWNVPEGTDPAQLSISGINNVDNVDYKPIFNDRTGDGLTVFNYLYSSVENYKKVTDSANVLDQSLQLKFDTTSLPVVPDDTDDLSPAGELYANRNFKTMDFSQHRELRFLLYGDGSSSPQTEFFLKVGTEKNYDKVIVPTNFDGWRLISLKMVDGNGDGVTDTLENVSDPSYNVRVVSHRVTGGLLSFSQVSLLLAGVQKAAGSSGGTGHVWLNVIHLAKSITLTGDAYKASVDIRAEEWGSAGAKYRHKDSNFQTPLSISKKQETTEEEYYIKVDRIKEFPMQANLTRSEVVTPYIVDSSDYNTVSLLDKGRVERQNMVVRGDWKKDNMPNIGLEYTQDKTEYDVMRRKDNSRTYGATLTHSVGVVKNLSAGYYYTNSSIDYDRIRHLESDSYYNTEEDRHKMNAKVTLQPHKTFTFTPSYSYSKSTEDRQQYHIGGDTQMHYPKAMSQRTGFNSTWKIARWLAPSASYNVSTVENNNLTGKKAVKDSSVSLGVGSVKTVTRSADGGVSLTLSGNELLPKSKLFNTFVINTSYRLQDADAWSDVSADFDSRKALWVRKSLKDVGAYGYRRSLTLRDTISSTQRWSPLSKYDLTGAAAPLKTISIMNNFSKTMQQNDQTGSVYDSTSVTLPDITFSISDLEQFFYAGRWLSSSNLKLRYSWIEQENIGTDLLNTKQYGGDLRFMLFNHFDSVLNYTRKESDKTDLRAHQSLAREVEDYLSVQTSFYVKSMRVTPKLLYNTRDKWQANGKISESYTQWIPSVNLRLDFNLPHGIKLPFLNRIYSTTNRIIWNTNLSYTDKRSNVEVNENYKSYDLTTSLDYELSANLRLTLSGGLTLFDHAYVATEDYTAYNVAANVTVQF